MKTQSEPLPKFLLMENPLDDERVFIYHSQTPRFIAQVIDDTDIILNEWIDQPDKPSIPARLMRQAGEWYNKYCDWEDRATDPTRNTN